MPSVGTKRPAAATLTPSSAASTSLPNWEEEKELHFDSDSEVEEDDKDAENIEEEDAEEEEEEEDDNEDDMEVEEASDDGESGDESGEVMVLRRGEDKIKKIVKKKKEAEEEPARPRTSGKKPRAELVALSASVHKHAEVESKEKASASSKAKGKSKERKRAAAMDDTIEEDAQDAEQEQKQEAPRRTSPRKKTRTETTASPKKEKQADKKREGKKAEVKKTSRKHKKVTLKDPIEEPGKKRKRPTKAPKTEEEDEKDGTAQAKSPVKRQRKSNGLSFESLHLFGNDNADAELVKEHLKFFPLKAMRHILHAGVWHHLNNENMTTDQEIFESIVRPDVDVSKAAKLVIDDADILLMIEVIVAKIHSFANMLDSSYRNETHCKTKTINKDAIATKGMMWVVQGASHVHLRPERVLEIVRQCVDEFCTQTEIDASFEPFKDANIISYDFMGFVTEYISAAYEWFAEHWMQPENRINNSIEYVCRSIEENKAPIQSMRATVIKEVISLLCHQFYQHHGSLVTGDLAETFKTTFISRVRQALDDMDRELVARDIRMTRANIKSSDNAKVTKRNALAVWIKTDRKKNKKCILDIFEDTNTASKWFDKMFDEKASYTMYFEQAAKGMKATKTHPSDKDADFNAANRAFGINLPTSAPLNLAHRIFGLCLPMLSFIETYSSTYPSVHEYFSRRLVYTVTDHISRFEIRNNPASPA